MTDASDPKSQLPQKKRLALALEQKNADIVAVIETPSGRRFAANIIFRILGMHNVSRPDAPEAEVRAGEGKRAAAKNLLLEIMTADPAHYRAMWSEYFADTGTPVEQAPTPDE